MTDSASNNPIVRIIVAASDDLPLITQEKTERVRKVLDAEFGDALKAQYESGYRDGQSDSGEGLNVIRDTSRQVGRDQAVDYIQTQSSEIDGIYEVSQVTLEEARVKDV